VRALAVFRDGLPTGSGKQGRHVRIIRQTIPKVSPQLQFGDAASIAEPITRPLRNVPTSPRSGLTVHRGAPMMVINPSRHEPDHEPLLDVELAAEVGRLTAGPEGESPIERIYRECDGPVSRRKAILQLSSDRLGACIQRHVRRGATELTVVAMVSEVTLEVAYAPRVDWLRDGPVAQRKITFPLLRAERGSDKTIPNGTAEGSW